MGAGSGAPSMASSSRWLLMTIQAAVMLWLFSQTIISQKILMHAEILLASGAYKPICAGTLTLSNELITVDSVECLLRKEAGQVVWYSEKTHQPLMRWELSECRRVRSWPENDPFIVRWIAGRNRVKADVPYKAHLVEVHLYALNVYYITLYDHEERYIATLRLRWRS